ncbi:MAG TPA: hypothetical protein VJY33_01040 [Isosphaeraceae bacterium]|nr:hypothetical protein [Isosphaeraceae bacterium]
MSEPLIAATVIGSWSFPGWYEKFIGDVGSHPDLFDPVDREEAVRDAVRLAIDDQSRAGLDRISDGEMQRVDFNLGFYAYLGGLKPIRRVRHWGAPAHDQRERYRCLEPHRGGRGLPRSQRRDRGPHCDRQRRVHGRRGGGRRFCPVALEFASLELAEVQLLAELPETMDVAVGLVDVKNTWIESAELVASRIQAVLKHVSPERLSVTPDCGFSRQPDTSRWPSPRPW